MPVLLFFFFFFFNDTATTEIYPLSLHDALPICSCSTSRPPASTRRASRGSARCSSRCARIRARSEEHTSELQSHLNLVCRLLLEKKKKDSVSNAEPLYALAHNPGCYADEPTSTS